MKTVNLLTKSQMRLVKGGTEAVGICDYWMTNPDFGICYNCCTQGYGEPATEEEQEHVLNWCVDTCGGVPNP